MATTGKVKDVTSSPRGFTVTDPGPPPQDVAFTMDISDDDWAVVLACYTKGSDAEVSGTPPSCGSVKGK